MPLLTIILVLAGMGIVLWLVNAYIPMPPSYKKLINIVAIVITVIWLLKIVGLWDYLSKIHI